MMRRVDEYMKVNRANWDQRAPAHATSPEYNLQRFIDDSAFISDVVQFDRPLLGDVRGLNGVHLQCHIGTDTVSLSRLGARMTGLDFSLLTFRISSETNPVCGKTAGRTSRPMWSSRPTRPMSGTTASARS
jgi:hypothetical protein